MRDSSSGTSTCSRSPPTSRRTPYVPACREPATWPWSSYRATIGLDPAGFLASERLLSFFGTSREVARERYRAHVETGTAVPEGISIFLGSDRFAVRHTRELGPLEEVPRAHWRPVRPPLAAIVGRVDNAAIARAYLEHGYTMREIAEHLGIHYATVSRRLRRHEEMSERKT